MGVIQQAQLQELNAGKADIIARLDAFDIIGKLYEHIIGESDNRCKISELTEDGTFLLLDDKPIGQSLEFYSHLAGKRKGFGRPKHEQEGDWELIINMLRDDVLKPLKRGGLTIRESENIVMNWGKQFYEGSLRRRWFKSFETE